MEERKKTQVADMDRGVYDIKNDFEYSYISDAGLTEDIIREIWSNKNEPEWMLDFRLIIFGACALNNYYDQDIDQIMPSKQNRPSVNDRIS
ncbi:FeS assembly protein SufB, partial [human gut metagenome]